MSKNNKYEIDMCNGSIMDKLISFSIPLMLSGILQLLFNAVDIVVVGRFPEVRLWQQSVPHRLLSMYSQIFLLGFLLGQMFLRHVFMQREKQEKCRKRYILQLHWR